MERAHKILQSRRPLVEPRSVHQRSPQAAEGGCGVLGFACNLPLTGVHVLSASSQMHNRGNGKGGGIAMVGLDAAQAHVAPEILRGHYLLQIALLDPQARAEVESNYIYPYFEVAQAYEIDRLDDYRQVDGLEVRPPDVFRYFVRVKNQVLADFAAEHHLQDLPQRAVEDEFVYQNSFKLNRQFYASLGEQRAFVLSHGRNLSVLKIVGYAEQVVQYYRLEDQSAHVWIAHQRYPTKGRVWHPGGAHPFIGLNEALVHNGDFANYHAVSEYLRQRNIEQLFLTDTEVSVQLFDLLDRVYGYPLEVTLEAMAPTSEFDFAMLPPQKQELYQAVQRAHLHASPDGPWFFILGRSMSDQEQDRFELLGITDTSMLRPQVFALYENNASTGVPSISGEGVQLGVIASERQAINACLRSLAEHHPGFQPLADRYWVARGGSHTDGGAIRFSVTIPHDDAHPRLETRNKFNAAITLPQERWHVNLGQLDPQRSPVDFRYWWQTRAVHAYDDGGAPTMWRWVRSQMPVISWDELAWGLNWLVDFAAHGVDEWGFALNTLNYLHDWRFNPGRKKVASVTRLVDDAFEALFQRVPLLKADGLTRPDPARFVLEGLQRVNWETRQALYANPPDSAREHAVLLLDALGFLAEGEESAAHWIVQAYHHGWRRIIAYNWRGGRFAGNGLGPESDGLRLDLYGDVGDYAASGLDGAQVFLHGAGQDQVGQILKRGKLVIYGDAGQTFLYGAKGGDVYVQGSVAGRPLINAVGSPRAVINGTCLDYLAESFMAGDPLNGGGFVILNGVSFDEFGVLRELESPYPGGNLFSLASGGAIYLRDPHRQVVEEQLNGGVFRALSQPDWELIEPYLLENERLFGIRVEDLLSVDGVRRPAEEVYRVVQVTDAGVLIDKNNL